MISSVDRLIALGSVCAIIILPGMNMSRHGTGVAEGHSALYNSTIINSMVKV